MAKAKEVEQEVEVILNDGADDDGLDFLNWQAPPEQLDADSYPYIQWSNDHKMFEFPLKHWTGTVFEKDYEIAEIKHRQGQEIELGALVPQIHVAVIAYRTAWEQEEDGRKIYSADYQPGMTKRYHFFCLVKEADTLEPAIITLHGYTGQYLQGALKVHQKTILKMASKYAGGNKFPLYYFWIPLQAGGEAYVGKEKQSKIFPPAAIYEIDGMTEPEILKALYIGNEYRDAIQNYLYNESQGWIDDREQQQLRLTAGSTVSTQAEILPGGILVLPDLSDQKRETWIDLGYSIPGLFEDREAASKAFSKMLRTKGLTRDTRADQWEAWREYLEERFETEQLKAREIELRD